VVDQEQLLYLYAFYVSILLLIRGNIYSSTPPAVVLAFSHKTQQQQFNTEAVNSAFMQHGY
jgi:hypothetical protein